MMRCTLGTHEGTLEMSGYGATFVPDARTDLLVYITTIGMAAVYRRNGDGDWMINSEIITLPQDADRWNLTQRELWPAVSLLDLAMTS